MLVGPVQPPDPHRFIEVIAHLAQAFHCPVLTDALNPLRNAESLHPYAITTYDLS